MIDRKASEMSKLLSFNDSHIVRKNIEDLIGLSLWNKGGAKADCFTFEELKKQAITALPAPVLPLIEMPSDLRTEWKKCIIQQFVYYTKYCDEQKNFRLQFLMSF